MRARTVIYRLLLASLIVTPAASTPNTTLRDALGHEVSVGSPPRRIVSLSPNLTEMLFAIGVRGDRVAGVTRYCNFPPEVMNIHVIGGIVDPSIEGILALGPDLVVATRGNPVEILDRLRSTGIAVYAFDSQGGLETVGATLRRMIELVAPDDTARAEAALGEFERGLACLRMTGGAVSPDRRPTVYYYDPASPDWTAGPGTHISEAIALAGGTNVADDAPMPWPRYGAEVLVSKQPDWILVAAAGADTGAAARQALLATLREGAVWRGMSAVHDGRLCLVPGDWLLRPGPRILLAIRSLGRCLHPGTDWNCRP
jgi:iron complex transport system substrate-binding protein